LFYGDFFLGDLPDIFLKAARDRRDQERKKRADKIDPAINRKAVKAAWVDNQTKILNRA
jgi:hypothetical protein